MSLFYTYSFLLLYLFCIDLSSYVNSLLMYKAMFLDVILHQIVCAFVILLDTAKMFSIGSNLLTS